MRAASGSEFRCVGCGYGVARAKPPARCPMCGQRQWVASPAPPLVRAAVETAHVCAVDGCTAEATQAVFEAAVDAVTGDPILRPHALLPYLCASHAGSSTGRAELTWRGRHRLAHLGRMVSLVARLP